MILLLTCKTAAGFPAHGTTWYSIYLTLYSTNNSLKILLLVAHVNMFIYDLKINSFLWHQQKF
jgi:hypothetical protein